LGLKAAAVQMVSLNNDYRGNMARAEIHIIEAACKGAKLILLPEFALAGYTFEDGIWESAEPLKGRTYKWLKAFALKYDTYIGTCILETDGRDFFDTFILVGPDEFFFHRKIEPASYEAYTFTAKGINQNVFDTKLGRIGVAICFDTTKTHTIKSLIELNPDILLLTYSSPELPWFCLPKDRRAWVDEYRNTPGLYASFLACPVIVSNKTGDVHSRLPYLPPFLRMDVSFTEGTCILDRTGRKLSEIIGGPGIIVEDLEMKKMPGKNRVLPKGRWLMPFTLSTRITMDGALLLGGLRYMLSKKRKKAAARIYEAASLS
jgi:predicted amidohydrolase